jgi:hypothetical protein
LIIDAKRVELEGIQNKEKRFPLSKKRRAGDTIVGAVDSENYSAKGDISQQIHGGTNGE